MFSYSKMLAAVQLLSNGGSCGCIRVCTYVLHWVTVSGMVGGNGQAADIISMAPNSVADCR